MEESKFKEKYQRVRERDEKLANEQPLPTAEGVNVSTVFGLSLGIASIVFGIFSKYSVILALIALILSIAGYRKKRDSTALAGMICSCVGLILGIAFAVYRYLVMVTISGVWQHIMDSIFR